jgi:GNAT superfamily N-acetyltransferase
VSQQHATRQAVETDVPAITALTRAAYAKWVPVIGREPTPMAANYAEAVRQHRFDLIECDGQLAALLETIPAEGHLLIENVAVSPLHQGRGLGRALMAHAERLATSLGYREIRLYTNKLFTSNVQLYGRLGYRVDCEEAFRGGTTLHMSKPIPRSSATTASS